MSARDRNTDTGFVHISSVVERVMAEIDQKRAERALEARRRVLEEPPEERAS